MRQKPDHLAWVKHLATASVASYVLTEIQIHTIVTTREPLYLQFSELYLVFPRDIFMRQKYAGETSILCLL